MKWTTYSQVDSTRHHLAGPRPVARNNRTPTTVALTNYQNYQTAIRAIIKQTLVLPDPISFFPSLLFNSLLVYSKSRHTLFIPSFVTHIRRYPVDQSIDSRASWRPLQPLHIRLYHESAAHIFPCLSETKAYQHLVLLNKLFRFSFQNRVLHLICLIILEYSPKTQRLHKHAAIRRLS
jgi:hypothetical protein